MIQLKRRKREMVSDDEAFFILATYHVLNGMKLVAELENLDLSLESDTDTARKKSITLIGQVVAKERKQQGDQYNHDRFFKQTGTSEAVRAHIRASYEK